MTQKLSPISPGEILLEEFLRPGKISQEKLSRDIDVPKSRISGIVHGQRAITADTGLRLSANFGTTPIFWLNLQSEYDLRKMRQTTWPAIVGWIRKMAVEA